MHCLEGRGSPLEKSSLVACKRQNCPTVSSNDGQTAGKSFIHYHVADR